MSNTTIYINYKSQAKVNSKRGKLFKYLNQIESGERNAMICHAIEKYYYPELISEFEDISEQELKVMARRSISDLWGQIHSLAILAGLDVEEMLGRRVNSVGEAKAPSTVELSQESSEESSEESSKEGEKEKKREKTKIELIMEARKKDTESNFPIDDDRKPDGEEALNSMIESF
ncbi:hypothetical protein FRE64_17090 (plasmid) [Euhalothece natronophila Z-M001]|uniref:Uncharacterized protein n=1 Tax=Euhalothece natronophila Z-M001 TaxID=522448 RepID=A0A5B8NT54_9CHRO|nr:hypothetical protein [Euhalothece natronophila]QDZ41681.1 hypothetical protein FRE64_17090 [Euhalothece natronophila Z-M001]